MVVAGTGVREATAVTPGVSRGAAQAARNKIVKSRKIWRFNILEYRIVKVLFLVYIVVQKACFLMKQQDLSARSHNIYHRSHQNKLTLPQKTELAPLVKDSACIR